MTLNELKQLNSIFILSGFRKPNKNELWTVEEYKKISESLYALVHVNKDMHIYIRAHANFLLLIDFRKKSNEKREYRVPLGKNTVREITDIMEKLE